MKKRVRNHKINTATARGRITAPRGEPYWHSLGKGCALGFRKTEVGPGTWVARWTDPEGEYHQKGLDSTDKLSFEEACTKAGEWFTQCKGDVIRSGTVQDACAAYVENLRNEKGDRSADRAEATLKQTVYGTAIASKKLDTLTTRQIEQWRNDLANGEREKNSANRILRTFKAALNFAFNRSMCPSDAAWKRVKAFKGEGATDGTRTAYLTLEQRQRLLAKCESKHDEKALAKDYDLEWATPELANFLRALLYTGARPNEIAAARVSDFDPEQKTLSLVSLKGAGVEKRREVALDDKRAAFFKRMAKDKLPGAWLLTCRGEQWQKQKWGRGIRAAVNSVNAEAQLSHRLPHDTVAYTMRHCAITEMLKASLDIATVAKITGTSVAMIDKNYHKFIVTDVRQKMAGIVAF